MFPYEEKDNTTVTIIIKSVILLYEVDPEKFSGQPRSALKIFGDFVTISDRDKTLFSI